MKKLVIALPLLLVGALLLSTLWGTPTKAIKAPADGTLQASSDSSLAAALSIKDMTEQSDVIAIGNCVDTRSVWVDRTLVTQATISVAETLKGGESSTIMVVLPGGIDANRKVPIAMTYPGAPQIQPGENVFLFLTADSDLGGYAVTGFSQGKFSIVTGDDGQQVVTRDLTKTTLKSNNGLHRGSANATPLGSFKAEVKKHLHQQ
jgi:hypothetical protein